MDCKQWRESSIGEHFDAETSTTIDVVMSIMCRTTNNTRKKKIETKQSKNYLNSESITPKFVLSNSNYHLFFFCVLFVALWSSIRLFDVSAIRLPTVTVLSTMIRHGVHEPASSFDFDSSPWSSSRLSAITAFKMHFFMQTINALFS